MPLVDEKRIAHWSEIGTRGAFGEALAEIGETMSDVVVLTPDVADSTRARPFALRFPERFFDVGVAEQNMAGVASGLAHYGKVPVAVTFGCFATTRCCEQIRDDIVYPSLNVKLVGVLSGVAQGVVGVTHYGVEDVGIVRCLPGIVILSPCDGAEVVKATWAAVQHVGPIYLRLTGGGNAPIVYHEDFPFEIGKAITLREGRDVALLATGSMVARALEAATLLKAKGLEARVVDVHTVKPLDNEVVAQAAEECRLVVTIEEHSIVGGLGSAIAEVMAESRGLSRLLRLGLPDAYLHFSTYEGYLEKAGLTAPMIEAAVLEKIAVGPAAST